MAAAAPITPAAVEALQADPCIAVHLDRTAKLRAPTSLRQNGNSVKPNIRRIGAATAVRVNGASTVGIAIMGKYLHLLFMWMSAITAILMWGDVAPMPRDAPGCCTLVTNDLNSS